MSGNGRIVTRNGARTPPFVTQRQYAELLKLKMETDAFFAAQIDELRARLDAADIPPVILQPPAEEAHGG